MTSLSIPDINVWLAILLADHAHRAEARAWWEADPSDTLALTRITQLGILRLLTTSAAMNGQPLTMIEAWAAYDRLFEDDRVAYLDEPASFERSFRKKSVEQFASPKLWADAYLAAFAEETQASIVTFDHALAVRFPRSIHLTSNRAAP